MTTLLTLLLSLATATAAPTGDTGDTVTGATGDTGATDTGATDTGTTDPGADLDEDNDGYTPRTGDCDDAEREIHPGQPEICADRLDNDCNGLFDDKCDDSAKLASLRGGGGCTGGQSVLGTSVLVLLGLGAARGRGRTLSGSRSR